MEVNSRSGRDGEAWTLRLTKNSAFPKFETLEKQINHVQLLTKLGGLGCGYYILLIFMP